MSSYQLYRNTTLGHTLQESLDELIQLGQITPQLALKVLLQFDKAINNALATRVKNRINFKGKLNTYRFCDNVWTLVLNNVEFKEVQEIATVDKVKIVACDGKVTDHIIQEDIMICSSPKHKVLKEQKNESSKWSRRDVSVWWRALLKKLGLNRKTVSGI